MIESQYQSLKNMVSTILSSVSVLLLFRIYNFQFGELYTFIWIPIITFIYFLFRKVGSSKFLPSSVVYILAMLLSIVTASKPFIGLSENMAIKFVKFIIIIIGLTLLFYACFQMMANIFLKLSKEINLNKNKGITWLQSFSVIFIGWIIYWIPFIPGNIAGDGNYQLQQFYSMMPLTNHHPLMATLFQCELFNFGRQIVSDNFGLFLYIVVQFFICCLIYSYAIFTISKLGISFRSGFIMSIIIGFMPYWSFFSETFHKDGMFIALFTFFMT